MIRIVYGCLECMICCVVLILLNFGMIRFISMMLGGCVVYSLMVCVLLVVIYSMWCLGCCVIVWCIVLMVSGRLLMMLMFISGIFWLVCSVGGGLGLWKGVVCLVLLGGIGGWMVWYFFWLVMFECCYVV